LNNWSSDIDKNSRIFDMKNIPVLLKVISESYEKEMDESFCIEWFKGIVENYGTNVKFSGVNTEELVLSKDKREGSEGDDSFKVATSDDASIGLSFQMSYRFMLLIHIRNLKA
jgi:hypothetical protein